MAGSRKKILIAVIVIAAVVAAGLYGFFQLRNLALTTGETPPDTLVLRKSNLESKVTASGNFASREPISVGAAGLGGEVAYVLVSEGEKVYAGDVLAFLKTAELERSIADTQSTISDLVRGDRQKIEAAQRAVNDAQAQTGSDNYWTQVDINNAQAALDAAQAALDAAPAALKKAKTNLTNAQTDLEDYLLNTIPPDPIEQAKLEQAVEAAVVALEKAQMAADNAPAAVEQAQIALDQAKRLRDTTLRANSSRLTEAQAQLDALQGVDSAKLSRSQLASLKDELANSSIISPITGIVTRVLAEEGKTAMGDMFFIEDTETLQIKATVAEFDIIKIQEGMTAHITSNATGSQVYSGLVEFVAPVASDLNGNFEVRVLLTSETGQLKPGMTATVEIVIAAKENIFVVPIDAVETKPDGTKVVYVFEPGGGPVLIGLGGGEAEMEPGGGAAGVEPGGPEMIAEGSGTQDATEGAPVKEHIAGGGPLGPAPEDAGWSQREIVVKTGMETDFYIEIISDELAEGMLIVADPMGRNIRFTGNNPMMIGGPAGGQTSSGTVYHENTVTYSAVD